MHSVTPDVFAICLMSTDLAQNYSVGLQVLFIPRLCSKEENYFFQSCMSVLLNTIQ